MSKLKQFLPVLIVLLLLVGVAAQCGAPATVIVEKEVVVTKEVEVEKEVVVTKEVEVEVEKEVVVTKEVEVEKEVVVTATPEAAEAEGALPGVPVVPDEPKKTDFEGVELRVNFIDEERERAIAELLPEFEEQTGIKVTIDFYGFNDLYNKNLTASSAHTGEYDVCHLHFPDMALFDERGYMLDLTPWVMRDAEEIQLDDIPAAIQDSHMLYKGRYFGMPMHMGAMMLYYRKDIFEKEGYPIPTTDTSWEDIIEIAKEIDAKYAPDVRAFVFMGRADIQGIANYFNFLGAYGGDLFDPDTYEPTFNSPESLQAMNTLMELMKYSIPESASYGFDEAHVAFQQGRAAMLPFWDSGDGFFSSPEISDVVDQWGVTAMPGGRATNGGWTVQISADSKNPEAAWEFLKWIVSPEMEARLTPMKTSCRTSVLTDPANAKYPSYQIFYDIMTEGQPFNFPKILPNWQMLETAAQGVNMVLTEQATPEEGLDWVQNEFEVILLRYGLWTP